MFRIRLAVKKEGSLCFLSHLDFARAVRYVIIRAKLPICYSEGFNPHMKLSFASALGVGVAADCEYMEMELAERVPVDYVIERMNAVSPHGFAVMKGSYVEAKAAKLMAMANYAVYILMGPAATASVDTDSVTAALDRFNQAQTITYEKQSPKGKHKIRYINVKDHVIEPVTGDVQDTNVYVTVGIYQTAEGAIKPSQVWEVLADQFGLPVHADMMLARRKAVYMRRNGINHSLFEE
ncbi:MAG: TIGR03936 family radical SAM-associated protein [Megasphaera sp.]|jgi:radical SAM-linked protein|nr:TIGR03936 family radical SAM-associated protein [Megasphaera sp.]MCI1247750.1 TIGR03936 family radical SAM-associated protein [Megasphaera sp.]